MALEEDPALAAQRPQGLTTDDGPAEDMSGDLASFLEAQEASEGDDDGAEGGTTPTDSDAPSDEGGDTEGEPAPRSDSHSRLVRKLAQRDREITGHRAQVRDLQRQLQEATAGRSQDVDISDPLDFIRNNIARHLRVEVGDPRVREALFELGLDITAEHLGDAAKDDALFRGRAEKRAEERRRSQDRRVLEERIERIEREKQEADRRANEAGTLSHLNRILQGDARVLPFLMAQTDVDPASAVMELMQEAVRTGQAPRPRTDDPAEADRLATQFARTIAKNLDNYWRGIAKTLAGRLSQEGKAASESVPTTKKSTTPIANRNGQRTAKTQTAPTRRTGATGTGGGGRGRVPETRVAGGDDDSESLVDFFKRQTDIETAGRRGRR